MLGLSIIAAIAIILFFTLNKWYFSPKKIGERGETKIARELKRLDQEQYSVLNDVLINTKKYSSQIDHLIVSPYGIFVIETKNYKGWIFGNEKSEYWKQVIYDYKSKFRNPTKQNWAHIFALRELLINFTDIFYHPIVVFAGSAELKGITSNMPVIYEEQLTETIIQKSINPHLTKDQIVEIVQLLSTFTKQEKKFKKNHISQTKMHITETYHKESALICPKCGNTLKIKDGRYGKFYGCSNYPRCRYTNNL